METEIKWQKKRYETVMETERKRSWCGNAYENNHGNGVETMRVEMLVETERKRYTKTWKREQKRQTETGKKHGSSKIRKWKKTEMETGKIRKMET